MSATAVRRQFGGGPLARVAALVYTLLVVEFLLLVTTLPGLVPLVLLEHDASNVPLAAACALPLGPALSAAVYAVWHRSADLTDLRPAAAFWRGYRANLRGVLLIWLPWLAFMSVVGVNLANFAAAGVPGWWAVLLIVVAISGSLWLANALVIASLFAFRGTDVARLASYFLVRSRGVTVGNACLLVVAAGLTVYASDAVLALLASVLVLTLVRNCAPMIAEVQEEFIA